MNNEQGEFFMNKLTLNKNGYSIVLDEKGGIESLIFAEKQFVGKRFPLFNIRMRSGASVTYISSDDAGNIACEATEDGGKIEFTFDKVKFFVEFTVSEKIEWKFGIHNETGLIIEWIDCPQIAVPNDLVANGGSGRVLLDINEGLLCEDIDHRTRSFGYSEPEYPSEGLMGVFPAVVESQFVAYYDDTAGLYFAAHDKERNLKSVEFQKAGDDAIKLQIRLYPGVCADTTDYFTQYPTVMQFFKGGWEEPAELYRSWFEQNLPEGMKKIEENDELPEWYTDSPIVVAYPVSGIHDVDVPNPNKLFPYANALPFIERFAEETDSRIMALLMHWEGTAPWAPPFVWPPLGGEDIFKEFASSLHEKGNLFGVYCSGTGYTIKSNLNDYSGKEKFEDEHLADIMCKAPDESLPLSHICRDQRSGYDMCVSCEKTKEILCSEAEKMASGGVDYIQILDQNHGGTPYFCYSGEHSHPPVPGKWQVEHMHELLSRLKEKVGKNVLLGCESAAAETYIPQLSLSDNRFSLNYHCGKPVPLYAYIYHEYVNNFSGNAVNAHLMADVVKSPESFYLRMAHSFIAGDLMTIVMTENGEPAWNWCQKEFDYMPNREDVMTFIASANGYRRKAGKKFLCFGKMTKPCKVTSGEITVYKPFFPDYTTKYPEILTSCWISSDGEKAQFLANCTGNDTMCEIELPESGAVVVDCDGSELFKLDGGKQSVCVKKHEALMLKF